MICKGDMCWSIPEGIESSSWVSLLAQREEEASQKELKARSLTYVYPFFFTQEASQKELKGVNRIHLVLG